MSPLPLTQITKRLIWLVPSVAVTCAVGQTLPRPLDPVRMLPSVDVATLVAGQPVVELVKREALDLAVIGIARTTADPETLFAWFRQVEQLQRSAYVPVLQRFSTPPRIDDLAALVLDEAELKDLRACRPGACEVKLSAEEIADVSTAIERAGIHWRDAAQDAFRQVLLARVSTFRADGFGRAVYDDHRKRVWLDDEFQRMASGCWPGHLSTLARPSHLGRLPASSRPVLDTAFFWSRDVFDDAKAIVGITGVTFLRDPGGGLPPLVIATQVYASHYITASQSITTIAPSADGTSRYLLYIRCTRADVFNGMFGSFIRHMVNKRIRREGPAALDSMRRKVETGPPPEWSAHGGR